MKLEIAAIEYADVAGSETEFVDETDRRLADLLAPEANDKLRHQILGHLSIASFMIVLGDRVPSFGAGVELGRVGHSTPVLYLNPRGVRRSCWIDDGALFAHLEVAEFDDVTEAVDIATTWLARWHPMIQRRWRERQARMLRTAPIAASFLDSWTGLASRESRLEAFTRTGLPADTFFGLFTPDGVAAAPLEDLQAMASALGVAPTALMSRRTFTHYADLEIAPLTKREFGAFLTAWDIGDWDSDRADRVLAIGRERARSRMELAEAGVDARHSLNHHTAWLRLEAEL